MSPESIPVVLSVLALVAVAFNIWQVRVKVSAAKETVTITSNQAEADSRALAVSQSALVTKVASETFDIKSDLLRLEREKAVYLEQIKEQGEDLKDLSQQLSTATELIKKQMEQITSQSLMIAQQNELISNQSIQLGKQSELIAGQSERIGELNGLIRQLTGMPPIALDHAALSVHSNAALTREAQADAAATAPDVPIGPSTLVGTITGTLTPEPLVPPDAGVPSK